MRGKTEETSTNGSSSKSDDRTIQSNPYVNTNVDQREQVLRERDSEEPPPPYIADFRASSKSQPQTENFVQISSLNNQSFQQTPIPQNYVWGRQSATVVCPTCGTTVQTRVETNSTIVTILLAIILFFFCLCLAIIPFIVPACKRTTHYCPKCNRMLGRIREFQ